MNEKEAEAAREALGFTGKRRAIPQDLKDKLNKPWPDEPQVTAGMSKTAN